MKNNMNILRSISRETVKKNIPRKVPAGGERCWRCINRGTVDFLCGR